MLRKVDQPDGTRLYVLDVPVHPDHADRKRGWETATVCCWDADESDPWRGERGGVRYVVSAISGCEHGPGFTSWSGGAKTDDDALWEACRAARYHW